MERHRCQLVRHTDEQEQQPSNAIGGNEPVVCIV